MSRLDNDEFSCIQNVINRAAVSTHHSKEINTDQENNAVLCAGLFTLTTHFQYGKKQMQAQESRISMETNKH